MVKIDTVELHIGDKTIKLSLEELKELRDILDATFPKEKVTVVPQPYPVYPPWRVMRTMERWDGLMHWATTINSNAGNTLSMSLTRN